MMKRKPSGAMRRKLRAKLGMPLTVRELEVVALLAQGLSNKQIADTTNMSERTAKFHIENIITKYGAQTRTDAAVKYAMSTIPPCSSCGASASATA